MKKNFEIIAERTDLSVIEAKVLIEVYKNPYQTLYHSDMSSLRNKGYIIVSEDRVNTTVEGDELIESIANSKIEFNIESYDEYITKLLIDNGFDLKPKIINNTSIMTKSLGTKLFAVDVNTKGFFRVQIASICDLEILRTYSYEEKFSRDGKRSYLKFKLDNDKIDVVMKELKAVA